MNAVPVMWWRQNFWPIIQFFVSLAQIPLRIHYSGRRLPNAYEFATISDSYTGGWHKIKE